MLGGEKATMDDFVERESDGPNDLFPRSVLLVGTSMSAGKTTAGQVVVNRLKRMGNRVVAAKLAGAGRYRDILAMREAGADTILDFVDVGLPSTVCPANQYRDQLRLLLVKIRQAHADAGVIEVGASPMEPYNGPVAIEAIREHIGLTVLCTFDPYAVVGVMEAYADLRPDLVTGPATNTQAGIELIEQLSGIPALNVLDEGDLPRLDGLLRARVP